MASIQTTSVLFIADEKAVAPRVLLQAEYFHLRRGHHFWRHLAKAQVLSGDMCGAASTLRYRIAVYRLHTGATLYAIGNGFKSRGLYIKLFERALLDKPSDLRLLLWLSQMLDVFLQKKQMENVCRQLSVTCVRLAEKAAKSWNWEQDHLHECIAVDRFNSRAGANWRSLRCLLIQ